MIYLIIVLAVLVGVLIGQRIALALRTVVPPLISAPVVTVQAPVRPASPTPVSGAMVLGLPGALEEERFASLLRDAVADVIRQHGAAAAVIWRLRNGALVRDRVVGDDRDCLSDADGVDAMVQWSMSEGLAQLGPDGDAPRAAITPLALPGEEANGALGLLFAQPFTGDRGELKRWLMRHGAHLRLLDELLGVRHELAKTNKRIRTILRDIQQWDSVTMDEGLGAHYCTLVEQLLNAPGAALVRWYEAEGNGRVVAAHGSCLAYLDQPVDHDSLVAEACRENVPGIWHDVTGRGEGPTVVIAKALAPVRGCVLIQPLRRRTEVVGAIIAVHDDPGALSPADLRTLSLVDAAATSRLLATWRLEEAQQQAMVDGLTGLTNRKGFEAAMTRARDESARYGWEIALILVDVDHFKRVNDTYGHEAGDDVLRAVANVLNDRVREIDVCARVGGEEIAILLKNTGAQGATELANRLRLAVEQLRVTDGANTIKVTASFGIATYPHEVTDWEALYRSADQALYASKHGGRNQVRHFAALEE